MELRTFPRRTALVIAAAGAAPVLGACDLLNTPGGEPEEVAIHIESSDVSDVNVVTSMNFLVIPNSECPEECPENIELVQADTANPAVPFDEAYRFTDRLQFFVEAFPSGDQPVTLSMRVTIDGRVWYDDFRTLAPPDGGSDRETLRFVYRYREGGVY